MKYASSPQPFSRRGPEIPFVAGMLPGANHGLSGVFAHPGKLS